MATAVHEMPLNKRIRWARKRAGYSQEKFAAVVGTTRRHVIRWENGQHAPNPHFRRRIADVTGQQPELFSNGDDEEEDSELAGALLIAVRAILRAEREKVIA